METLAHDMSSLFAQLGLPADAAAIDSFIAAHNPLPSAVALVDAPFWSSGQAAFLQESLLDDSDWAVVIDDLNERLRGNV